MPCKCGSRDLPIPSPLPSPPLPSRVRPPLAGCRPLADQPRRHWLRVPQGAAAGRLPHHRPAHRDQRAGTRTPRATAPRAARRLRLTPTVAERRSPRLRCGGAGGAGARHRAQPVAANERACPATGRRDDWQAGPVMPGRGTGRREKLRAGVRLRSGARRSDGRRTGKTWARARSGRLPRADERQAAAARARGTTAMRRPRRPPQQPVTDFTLTSLT